ncbi:hypothetical protein CYMTET_9857 [Cymbomonas tetramitiformis]|uniref:Glutathione S-transferase n=1 Tax=Cymbomonas tetramitiformis TaxID=36881 RepID=A0AAE0GQB2_9CHLO|nr:hypothetical protein CYMTET_9857 [Cymbomonas tetramitiformis]
MECPQTTSSFHWLVRRQAGPQTTPHKRPVVLPIKIFWNLRSAPSRTVVTVARATRADAEYTHVDLVAQEHKSDEYIQQINPLGKVPAALLPDRSTTLWESAAICKYLCMSSRLGASLYPADPLRRAKVDMYYDFWNCYLHPSATEVMNSQLGLVHYSDAALEETFDKLHAALRNVDSFFKAGEMYLTGNSLTIADMGRLGGHRDRGQLVKEQMV